MFLLHLRYATGFQQTVTFSSPFDRALIMITLSAQSVIMRTENLGGAR